ncbi:putative vacuolar protein-sorting protein bro1 [Phaeomoniella chlamydospora]|uniref:BRO domain-containing protein 1 n=1 Tax=Phaeomoniella chlamydospora TaxID=158046 RepID=A0A0G2DT16_PHACM|nr:putative vacuolar protein-sorting protein bro1 [Phaeomoniella chlamydospora]
MVQAPMISSPLKQTNEIDWTAPLKGYIRTTYGDDPERYSEECATLNRLRQDMRGAGKDSAAGRDLLYRYYGQLELLDLRFPVDENHIKISFTWFDAFTHKATSQHSLAFEKASIIFNISAVLSCHAAAQDRSEENGLKTAYHSFQASAGMFTYINENFLHAPSTDLSRDTVKTLISITLAQGQEVFLEKQVADGKKPGLLAKLAAQAHFLYTQAMEGVQENVAKAVFDRTWQTLTTVKAAHTASLSEYYQALVDEDAGSHGSAIARLQLAEKSAKSAYGLSKSFPPTPPSASNLGSETSAALQTITKKQLENVQEKLVTLVKDNDFIYHQPIPAEASLSAVSKLPAAKPIPVSELYQGQDIQRIIGPDIFQKIVPLAVTESASLYDEEKAKLVRAEAEKIETADGEMAASLDYLKLPGSLNILRGGMDQEMTVEEDFRRWCEDISNHEPFQKAFDQLARDKSTVLDILDKCSKQLDMEESVCEKMRSKYGGEWTQQPSSRLTTTLRDDVRTYRSTIDQASNSDAQLHATARQYETDFEELRSAGERGEADLLFQQAMIKAGAGRGNERGSPSGEGSLLDEDYSEGGPSVPEQIAKVEDLLKKLNLIKRERSQVLKDLKEKVHNDDISNVLILNKKALVNGESELFQAELEKFRPHQNRLLSTVHKQSSLLKDLTKTYGALLQDKRVRSDQQKYERITKSRGQVMAKYKKAVNAFEDLIQGLLRAQSFYGELKDSVESLEQNVDSFVNNRRGEGSQLLNQIEQNKANIGSQPFTQGAAQPVSEGYNPMAYPYQTPISPAPPSAHPYYTPMSATPGVQHNGAFYGSPPPAPGTQQPQLHRTSTPHQQLNFTSPTSQTPQPHMYAMAGGYMPPPPPPGPPGGGSQTVYPPSSGPFPAGPGGYAQFGRADRLPTVTASAALEAVSLAYPPITTNLPSLDDLLQPLDPLKENGGVSRGQATEIYGPPGSGKTALAMQIASNALHADSKSHVCWIDTAGPIPPQRLEQFLRNTPSTNLGTSSPGGRPPSSLPDLSLLDSMLTRFHQRQVFTLPHLLTLFLHPTPEFPPPSTSLVVIDNISSLFNVSFPHTSRSSSTPPGTKASAISFASTRRFAIAGDLSNALAKLAALRNLAVIVINQTGTSITGLNRAILKPAVGGKEWDVGIATRCVIYRDFVEEQIEANGSVRIEKRSCRWVEVVKGGRRENGPNGQNHDGLVTGKRRVAFGIDEVSLGEYSLGQWFYRGPINMAPMFLTADPPINLEHLRCGGLFELNVSTESSTTVQPYNPAVQPISNNLTAQSEPTTANEDDKPPPSSPPPVPSSSLLISSPNHQTDASNSNHSGTILENKPQRQPLKRKASTILLPNNHPMPPRNPTTVLNEPPGRDLDLEIADSEEEEIYESGTAINPSTKQTEDSFHSVRGENVPAPDLPNPLPSRQSHSQPRIQERQQEEEDEYGSMAICEEDFDFEDEAGLGDTGTEMVEGYGDGDDDDDGDGDVEVEAVEEEREGEGPS